MTLELSAEIHRMILTSVVFKGAWSESGKSTLLVPLLGQGEADVR